MRKLSVLFLLFAVLSMMAMSAFAQDDDDNDDNQLGEATAESTLEAGLSGDDMDTETTMTMQTTAWVEIRIAEELPSVYIPADCVVGLNNYFLVPWTGDRDLSLAEWNMGETDAEQAPTGETLVTVICTTPIYSTPDGEAVEGESITAGQTWYATPYLWLTSAMVETEVSDTDAEATAEPSDFASFGQAWVEVRLTESDDPVYIPADCVAGLPFYSLVTWNTDRDTSILTAEEMMAQYGIDDANTTDDASETDTSDEESMMVGEYLVTVNCSTGIYEFPGGPVIEGESITAGQTWYVSPYVFLVSTRSSDDMDMDSDMGDADTSDDMEDVELTATPSGSGG